MAKALLGHRVAYDERLANEALRLRRRVQDLEGLVERLQRDNDALHAELLVSEVRRSDVAVAGVPTIGG